MWIAKKKFPQNTIKKIAHPQTKKGRRTPDLRLLLTRNECQSVKWKGWYSVFTGIPSFSLFISTAWLDSPLNKATRDTCDLHNHTFLEQLSRQNLDRKFWKLERVAYLAMETDKTMFADQLETSTTHWAFDHRMCQGCKGRGAFDDCLGEVSSWTGNVSGREECKGKKKWLFRRIACSARTSKGTDYIRTAFLKVWCIWCIRTRSSVIFL